uniref:Uncharacterized protein n=1 Tax=Rhizophora mucronata TaxID=61149 RepID=A0A2P2LWP8_RHIMU
MVDLGLLITAFVRLWISGFSGCFPSLLRYGKIITKMDQERPIWKEVVQI